jgi:uncharacterized protein (TIGR02145 family)
VNAEKAKRAGKFNSTIMKLIPILSIAFILSLNTIAQQTGTFTDPRDGRTYKNVRIGHQTWMAENLNYNTGSGSWCYENSNSNCTTYGRLYTWDAARTACPSGWHLPSDAEWTQLVNYLGGVSVAGGKLKSTTGWVSPNAGATNESNWSGLPGGALFSNVHFDDIGYYGSWWSSTGYNAGNAWYRDLFYYYGIVYRDKSYKTIGFSVRCLRDN